MVDQSSCRKNLLEEAETGLDQFGNIYHNLRIDCPEFKKTEDRPLIGTK